MKKVAFSYAFIGLLFLVGSCNNAPTVETPAAEYSLKGNLLKVDKANLGMIPELSLKNNIVISRKFDYYGSILTEKEWFKTDTLFLLGNGHNEFQFLSFAKGQNNSLLLLDRPWIGNKLLSLTCVSNTECITSMKDKSKWDKYDLSNLPPFNFSTSGFVSLTDSTILVPGAPYDTINHIFSIINYKNQHVYTLDYWPDDDSKCADMPKHSVYTNNSTLIGNDKGRYLYQCFNQKFAFIFTIDGRKIDIIKQLYSEYPQYTQDESKLNPQYFSTTEYMSSHANSQNIYLLFKDSDSKGQKIEKWVNPYFFGNTIEVYDWEGNKEKIIHLDKFGDWFYVSEDNKTLYLESEDADGKRLFWTYNLTETN